MPTRTLKLFYKGNKLSTLHTSSAYHALFSTNNQNLSETTSLSSQARLLATDAQESTVNTVSESQTTITYSPYGNDSCPPTHPLLSRFTGQSWLPSSTGYLLGNGHRLFDPRLMRFHSPDSLSPFEKGGINAYAYCTNDPINRSDPSGMYSIVKFITGGYSVNKIYSRLHQETPNLTSREYKILKKHIAAQIVKGTKETKAHYRELRDRGEERILAARLQDSLLTRLECVNIDGKTRYIGSVNRRDSISSTYSTSWEGLLERFEKAKAAGRSDVAPTAPTAPTSSSMPGVPSNSLPKIRPPSKTFLAYTGNFIDKEVDRLRSTPD